MFQSILINIPLGLMLAKTVSAACESGYTYGYCEDRIVRYYDPNTGELCGGLDCGGGRAPVKYDVPGCPAYTGTEEYRSTRSFMPCFELLKTATSQPLFLSTTSVDAEPTEEPVESSEPTEIASSSSTVTTTSIAQSTESEIPASSSSSVGSSSSSLASSAKPPTTPPATTPAATLSTVTQTSSTITSSPPATTDPGSGAESLQGPMVLVGALIALALLN